MCVYSVSERSLTPNNPHDAARNDRMYAEAEKSSLNTATRVKDAAKEKTKQGISAGGNLPYGYAYASEVTGKIKKGHEKKRRIIISEQAKVVEHIYMIPVQNTS